MSLVKVIQMRANATNLTVSKPIVERLRRVLDTAKDGSSVTKFVEQILTDALDAIEAKKQSDAPTPTVALFHARIHGAPTAHEKSMAALEKRLATMERAIASLTPDKHSPPKKSA